MTIGPLVNLHMYVSRYISVYNHLACRCQIYDPYCEINCYLFFPKFAIQHSKMSNSSFNVLTTNAVDLQRLLADGQITSVQMVQQCFDQIDRHEPALNALISPAPRDKVLRAAAALDEERSNGSVRGAFHGIPIVLKVCLFRRMTLYIRRYGG